MDLTLKERLMLANQCKILEKLYPDEANYYAACREALEGGYALHYNNWIEHFSEGLTTEQCSEVMNILDMYRALGTSYRKLEDTDGIRPAAMEFPGFDGNNETKHFAYARYLIHKLNRWEERRTEDLNSHSEMLGRYRDMLQEWQNSPNKWELSKDDILRISARGH